MPRTSRKKSDSGYYHVIMRGTGKMIVFEDDLDRRTFLWLLDREITDRGMEIIAWCLMSNHVHLLLGNATQDLSVAMQRINTCYARHFNNRHDHVGHVFQNRFFSNPIESEGYLLQAARYIMLNPVKDGLGSLESYRWTSYSEYLGNPVRCSTGLLLEMLGGVAGFEEFMNADVAPQDDYRIDKPSYDELSEALRKQLTGEDWDDLRGSDRARRDTAIAKLKTLGFTIRAAQRATGLGKSIIERAFLKA